MCPYVAFLSFPLITMICARCLLRKDTNMPNLKKKWKNVNYFSESRDEFWQKTDLNEYFAVFAVFPRRQVARVGTSAEVKITFVRSNFHVWFFYFNDTDVFAKLCACLFLTVCFKTVWNWYQEQLEMHTEICRSWYSKENYIIAACL
jgi:hypothetical protein